MKLLIERKMRGKDIFEYNIEEQEGKPISIELIQNDLPSFWSVSAYISGIGKWKLRWKFDDVPKAKEVSKINSDIYTGTVFGYEVPKDTDIEDIIAVLDEFNRVNLNKELRAINRKTPEERAASLKGSETIKKLTPDQVKKISSRMQKAGSDNLWDKYYDPEYNTNSQVYGYFKGDTLLAAADIIEYNDYTYFNVSSSSKNYKGNFGTKLFQWLLHEYGKKGKPIVWVSAGKSDSYYTKLGLDKYKTREKDYFGATYKVPAEDAVKIKLT